MNLWEPTYEQMGMAAGGLLLWAVVASLIIRTHPSLKISALFSIVAGSLTAVPVAFVDRSALPADYPILLTCGFAIGFSLFWVRYLTKQQFKLRWKASLPIDVLSIILITNILGYPISYQTSYNRAPREFAQGVFESREKVADAAMFRATFDAHPMLSRSIIQEAYGYGLPKEERKRPATDADGAAIIMKHVGQALSSDILIASDDSVVALFEANNELIKTLSEMGHYQCDALLNGKLSAEALVTYVGKEKAEAAYGLWQNVVDTAKTHVGPPFEVKNWQDIANSSLSAKANAEIDQLTGNVEKKNCLVEVIWRNDWKSFPAARKAIVARGALLSSLGVVE